MELEAARPPGERGPRPTTARGWLERAAGEPPAAAVPSLRRALALNPSWPVAHRELCRRLVELDDDEADAACARALALAPDDLATVGYHALALARAGAHEQALAALGHVIARDGDPRWRLARARVHERRGDAAAAAADRRDACALGLTGACP